VLNSVDAIVLYLHPLILLQTNLADHLDKELNLVRMFPVLSGQHWSLLVLVVKDLLLCAVDSGHLKIFGHSDMQYAPAIGTPEKRLDLNRKQATHSLPHAPRLYHPAEHTAQIMKNTRPVLYAQTNTPCIIRRVIQKHPKAYISAKKHGVYLAKNTAYIRPKQTCNLLPAIPFIARRAGARVATTHGRAHSCCGMPAAGCRRAHSYDCG
jgi:hypothetical protein